MSFSLSPVVSDVGTLYAIQTAASATVDTLDPTAGVLYKVEIDNTAGTSAVFVKGYDVAGAGSVNVGVTDPQWIFKCPAGTKRSYASGAGSAYANGFKVACTTTKGTAGNTSPTWAVSYGILLG